MGDIDTIHYNGDSIKTIAENMDCAEITVKTRLASARKKIKAGIEERFGKGVTLLGAAGFLVLGKAISAEAAALPIPESAANTAMVAVTKAAGNIGLTKAVTRQDFGGSEDSSTSVTGSHGSTAQTTNAVGTAAQTAMKTGLGMKLAVGTAGLLATVGIIALSSISNGNNSDGSGNHSLATSGSEQSQSTGNGSSGNSDLGSAAPESDTNDYNSTESQVDNAASETTKDSTSDSSWVPQELDFYVTELDYKAPDVYADVTDQCTFIWGHTEDDVVTWFKEQYADYTDETRIDCSNTESFDEEYYAYRTYSLKLEKDNAFADIEVSSSYLSETQAIGVSLQIGCDDFDTLMTQMTEFITFMGLGDYAEEIIHAESLTIETENGKGRYDTDVQFSTYASSPYYSMTLQLTASAGSAYEGKYTPNKLEHWDDDFSLSNYFPNCSFDTTSLEALAQADFEFTATHYNRDLTMGGYEKSYSYRQNGEDAEKTNVKFEHSLGKIYDHDSSNASFILALEDNEMSLRTYGHPYYGANEHNVNYAAKDISEEQIEELCRLRLEHLKKFDSTINITVEDLVAQYYDLELDGPDSEHYFEGNYPYYVSSDFKLISMSFDVD